MLASPPARGLPPPPELASTVTTGGRGALLGASSWSAQDDCEGRQCRNSHVYASSAAHHTCFLSRSGRLRAREALAVLAVAACHVAVQVL